MPRNVGQPQLKDIPLRFSLIALILLVPVVTGQGCATNKNPESLAKNPESLATEEARLESEQDAACRDKGAPATPAYEACRKDSAEARARQGAVQEQKRRDFDRTLGAGTESQSGY
jgi:hypothetical protein